MSSQFVHHLAIIIVEPFQPAFDVLLGQRSIGVIAAQLFGHVHKDEIRLLPHPVRGAGPIFLSSALSPVYYNNPSFKTVTSVKGCGRRKSGVRVLVSDGKAL